jgi:hypothetical protein
MKTGTDFEQAANAPVKVYLTGCRLGDAGKDFQERGFACAVAPNNANHFAGHYFEADIFERPDGVILGMSVAPKPIERRPRRVDD